MSEKQSSKTTRVDYGKLPQSFSGPGRTGARPVPSVSATLRLIRNNGQQPVKTKWLGMSVPMPDAFTVTDQTGAKVAVTIGHKNWDSPWTTLFKNGMLGVGDVHGLTVPYEISIGGDGSKNRLIGRVMNARPGQKLQFKVRELNGSTRQEADAESESGSISFIVVEGPIDPNAVLPDSDEDINPTNNTRAGHGKHWPELHPGVVISVSSKNGVGVPKVIEGAALLPFATLCPILSRNFTRGALRWLNSRICDRSVLSLRL